MRIEKRKDVVMGKIILWAMGCNLVPELGTSTQPSRSSGKRIIILGGLNSATEKDFQMLEAIAHYHGTSKSATIGMCRMRRRPGLGSEGDPVVASCTRSSFLMMSAERTQGIVHHAPCGDDRNCLRSMRFGVR